MIHISGFRSEILPEPGYNDTKNYITVNCCGYEKYITKNIKTFRENGLSDFQLIYMVKGSGYFEINRNMTDVPCGNIIVFHPGETQKYAYQFKDEPELYWVHFTGYGAYEFLDKVGLSNGHLFYVGNHSICIEYFKKILSELQLKEALYQQTANVVLLGLLAFLGRKRIDFENGGKKMIDPDIQRIIHQIHTEYGKKFSVSDFAKQCGLSSNRFMHKFKIQTGLSVIEYLIKMRISKAKDLLLNSSLSIKEISDVIGYENPLYFSRLFSKMEGISPKEYRINNYVKGKCRKSNNIGE